MLVAQAERDLLDSQLVETDGTILYRLALLRLYQAEGSLLDRGGIRIDPASASAPR